MTPDKERKAAMTWEFDRDTGEHFLHFDGKYMAVYKTPSGDYAITCRTEGDPCGGDVDYEPTLAKAKANAERRAESGTWLELAFAA
jgi:hypothetical protein